MSLVKRDLKTNVNVPGSITDTSDAPVDSVSVTNRTSVLFIVHCFEQLSGAAATNFDFTGAGAITEIRCTINNTRTEDGTFYLTSTAINAGHYPSYEDLSEGKFTMLIDFSAAAINTALGSDDIIAAYMEFSWKDNNDVAQILMSLPMGIKAKLQES